MQKEKLDLDLQNEEYIQGKTIDVSRGYNTRFQRAFSSHEELIGERRCICYQPQLCRRLTTMALDQWTTAEDEAFLMIYQLHLFSSTLSKR